jgi:predicted SprT family Zn-dependent metalloprotease
MLKGKFIIIFFLIVTACYHVDAEQFDDQDPIQYQFADDGVYTDRLLYTSEIMNYLAQTYTQEINQNFSKAQFKWNFDWSQNYLGAGSNLYQGTFSIMLYGGYVRAKGSTFQLIALTLCHEMGHYLGGAPKQRLENKNQEGWSSSEGQADWFAAQSCMPKLFQFFKKSKPQRLQIDLNLVDKKLCQTSSLKSVLVEQCQWILSAGLNFTGFAKHYYDRSLEPASLQKMASEKPDVTLHSTYPSLQCRLDTFHFGAMCTASLNDHSEFCVRPRCWYNPDKLF